MTLTLVPEPSERGLRPLPANIQAEQALLGAVLLQPKALDHVAGFLRGEHFSLPVHGRIYDATQTLIGRGEVANPVTLARYFQTDEALCDVGGPQYLARLAGAAVTIVNAPDYGRVILDLWARREAIRLSNEMIERAFAPEAAVDVANIASETIGAFDRLLDALNAEDRRETSMAAAMDRAIAQAEVAYQAGGGVTGVPTGLRDLDDLLGGFHAGELIIFAARPGQGKTALALGIAEHAAHAGHSVAFFSLEMPPDQLAQRSLAGRTGISARRMRKGNIFAGDWPRLQDVARDHQGVPLELIEAQGMTIDQCAATARRIHARRPLGLVVVDYLQLIAPSEIAKRRNRVDEVTEISAGLKRMARDLRAPVLALAQLNRALEARDNKRPRLSDLRDSGSIEQDADVIGFIHREVEYLRRDKPDPASKEYAQWEADVAIAEKRAELAIEKHRQGPCETIKLRWNADLTRFEDGPEKEQEVML